MRLRRPAPASSSWASDLADPDRRAGEPCGLKDQPRGFGFMGSSSTTAMTTPPLEDRLAAGDPDHRAGDVAGQEHIDRRKSLRLRQGASLVTSSPKWATASGGIVDGISGVHAGPGATALTRMRFSATSWASPAVKFWITPLLVASANR